MSGQREDTCMRKEKGDSKSVLNETKDRVKLKKKNEKRNPSERRKDEATSSNHFSPPKTSRNLPKRNIAQNRLKKLRTKLDTEIKLKDRMESVGISRLLDESVVKVEKSRALPNKQKLPKIPKIESRISSRPARNIASERLKKIEKELRVVTARNSVSTFEDDSLMEVDEDINEPVEKFPNGTDKLQYTKQISFTDNTSLLKNNSHFNGSFFDVNTFKQGDEVSFNESLNSTNNNSSSFDVIPFINDEISKIRRDPSYMASHCSVVQHTKMEVDSPVGDLLIVIDTNVLLSHLNIITYLLKDPSIPSLNSCVLVIPWPVIQEIDYAMKRNNERLNRQARFANNFINDCLKKKHPRFFGQSLVDFKENFKNAVNVDDFILQYCMQFVSFNKKVILLTNDKNLSNKAMINNISVFNSSEFVNQFDLSEFFS